MGWDMEVGGAGGPRSSAWGGMAGFTSFIYYLQACLFRCGGQGCLEDQPDLWEDKAEKGRSVGS